MMETLRKVVFKLLQPKWRIWFKSPPATHYPFTKLFEPSRLWYRWGWEVPLRCSRVQGRSKNLCLNKSHELGKRHLSNFLIVLFSSLYVQNLSFPIYLQSYFILVFFPPDNIGFKCISWFPLQLPPLFLGSSEGCSCSSGTSSLSGHGGHHERPYLS